MPPKHNLSVQGSYHPHGANHIVLDDKIHDLVVQEAYHLHVSSDLYDNAAITLNAYDLFPASIYHDHGVGHIVSFPQQQYLAVAGDYLVLTDDLTAVSHHIHLDFSGTLSDLQFDGAWGVRIPGDLWDLPGLEFTGYAGSNLDAKLPDMGISASMVVGAAGGVDDGWLSALEVGDNRFAWRADDMELPDLQLTITISDYLPFRLDVTLPGLKLQASGTAPFPVGLDVDLPFLKIVATCSVEHTANLDAKLPTLKSTTVSYGAPATLDEYLPTLSVSASGTSGDILTVDCKIPVVVLRAHPTGEAGGGRADPAVLQDEDRFGDDYVLRHQRYG